MSRCLLHAFERQLVLLPLPWEEGRDERDYLRTLLESRSLRV